MSAVRDMAWPGPEALQLALAAAVQEIASKRMAETGWSPQDTARRVGNATEAHIRHLAEALEVAAELALTVWLVTESGEP